MGSQADEQLLLIDSPGGIGPSSPDAASAAAAAAAAAAPSSHFYISAAQTNVHSGSSFDPTGRDIKSMGGHKMFIKMVKAPSEAKLHLISRNKKRSAERIHYF